MQCNLCLVENKACFACSRGCCFANCIRTTESPNPTVLFPAGGRKLLLKEDLLRQLRLERCKILRYDLRDLWTALSCTWHQLCSGQYCIRCFETSHSCIAQWKHSRGSTSLFASTVLQPCSTGFCGRALPDCRCPASLRLWQPIKRLRKQMPSGSRSLSAACRHFNRNQQIPTTSR